MRPDYIYYTTRSSHLLAGEILRLQPRLHVTSAELSSEARTPTQGRPGCFKVTQRWPVTTSPLQLAFTDGVYQLSVQVAPAGATCQRR